MSGEFSTVWEDENSPEFELNAANLSAISPHLLYLGKQLLYPVSGQKQKLRLAGGATFKVVASGIHKLYRTNTDIEFSPAELLDEGSTLINGKDYHLYLVTTADNTANLVVSLNATYPVGATAENSRRIGGFHTLCADIGALQKATHPLYGFMARDILPQSIWDLLNRPKNCEPQGMVLDPKTKTWIDIYLQSGTGTNTKSAYQGAVTKMRSWDGHQEDLFAVNKRMLTDAEFTSAALGTIPYKVVMGQVDPVTTGGKVNTDGNRIVSNIGCEDMCGCYWQWIGLQSCTNYTYNNTFSTNPKWEEAEPAGEGQQYNPTNAVVAGGSWGYVAHSGARARSVNDARSALYGHVSSRGSADSQTVI